MPTVLRTAVAGALAGSAKVFSFASKLLDSTATSLRTTRPSQAPPDEPASTHAPSEEPVSTTTTADVIERVERQVPAADLGRVTATAEELAPPTLPTTSAKLRVTSRNWPSAQPRRSRRPSATCRPTELRLLTEYELAHRKRKTVLAALERAARP